MELGTMVFQRQLGELGFHVDLNGTRCVIPYTVRAGRLKGTSIRLGFEIPPDFPRSSPTGPHISPRILPVNEGATSHPAKVLTSNFGDQFGGEWIYLSRPITGWRGKENVSKVLAHVDLLLETS